MTRKKQCFEPVNYAGEIRVSSANAPWSLGCRIKYHPFTGR
jgi:hypothetical protein